MVEYYSWIRVLHIIAIISWMAGLLYLPRLFVYHAEKAQGSEASEMLKVMERRLLKFITTPAMIIAFISGITLIVVGEWGAPGGQKWIHVKLLLVLLLAGFHGMCAKWRKDFAADNNRKSARFFRIANEVPTVLMIFIVILATVKPF